jgi:diketogulonate reductase-like aldo/keto reductase
MTAQSTLSMNDGNKIPVIGFGAFKLEEGKACEEAVSTALEAGYRHIDTASEYGNEASVGRAVEGSGIRRGELFLTTKLWPGPDESTVRGELERSLERLRTDHVDLYLVHWPIECYKKAWGVLERLKADGMCRSIGVSNYTVERFERDSFFSTATIVPAVNQVEMNVFNQRRDLASYCRKKGILMEAYRPLAAARKLEHDALQGISRTRNKTAAQVMIRYVIQRGAVAIPKSATPDRIRENIDVFDFALSELELTLLENLNDDAYFSLTWRPKNFY